VRKIPASLAVLGLVAVGLVGCSLPGSNACDRADDADASVLSGVTVSGETDEAPEVELYTPFHTDSAASEDVVVGEGLEITDDSQLIVMDISITSGETGENLVKTNYDGDLSRVSPVARWMEVVPGLQDVLPCATEGSRIVVALPPGGIEAATASSLELGEDDSAVAVIDIRKVYLPKADGADQFNVGNGLPSVVRDFIREHHGTTRVEYFLDRARKSGEEPDVAAFTYPGPSPHRAETAIAMLADSAEAAVRVLDDPTPESVRAAIDTLVARKIATGQLNDAPLTLRDLDRVKGEFTRILGGMRHHRIDYPASVGGITGETRAVRP